jgi:hypothetical protein
MYGSVQQHIQLGGLSGYKPACEIVFLQNLSGQLTQTLASYLITGLISSAWQRRSVMSQSVVQSAELLQSPSVIESLERVRERVQEQLIKVPEFRAFLAVETSISEVSQVPDLVDVLQSAKQKILDRLMSVREYQAMLAVEKSITEISEVLGVLAEGESASATPETPGAPQTGVNGSTPAADPPLKTPETASPLETADHLAKMLGLTDEQFDKRIR